MASPYTDDTGVFKNKLGLKDAGQLRLAEYEATTNRSYELIERSADIQQSGYGLARQQAIHRHLFQDVYEWAGQVRTVPSAKRMDNGHQSLFAEPDTIVARWQELEKKTAEFVTAKGLSFEQKRDMLPDIFIEANKIHAFPEGNGRSLQVFMKQLAQEQGVDLDYTKVNPREWNQASAVSGHHGRLFEHVHFIQQPSNSAPIRKIFADMAYPIQDKALAGDSKPLPARAGAFEAAVDQQSRAAALNRHPELRAAFNMMDLAKLENSKQPGRLDQVRGELQATLRAGEVPQAPSRGDPSRDR